MVSILLGGFCNLLDSKKRSFPILACLFYCISALSTIVISAMVYRSSIYVTLWIFALSISLSRCIAIFRPTESKKQIAYQPKLKQKDKKGQTRPSVEDFTIPHRSAPNRLSAQKSPASLARIDKMEGHEFEHFTADLLRKLGYERVDVTPGSGDQGVDVIAVKDGKRYAIQCKRYSQKLSNKPVQEVFAGKTIYGCSVAVVLTNNYFTEGTKEAAKATGVELWDRDTLRRMMDYANYKAIV